MKSLAIKTQWIKVQFGFVFYEQSVHSLYPTDMHCD